MKQEQKIVNLGLQGGGSHGAFGWGVLDYLLEDGRLDIDGVSATSAGSMNAVVLAQGMLHNDKDEARQSLHNFWQAISDSQKLIPIQSGFEYPSFSEDQFSLDSSPSYLWFNLISHVLSPYQFNPFNLNPLRDILEQQVDFDAITHQQNIKLFLCATNVETCKVKIFSGDDISIDAVLASACLPLLFQSVEINGEYYWDGGYIGNPAIFPLIYNCKSPDVIVIHINPIIRLGVPRTSAEILNRINEISFNSSLMREMRAVAFITTLIEKKEIKNLALKKMFMHSIRSDEDMASHDVSSKMNTDWTFLTFLRDRGRIVAEEWLKYNFSKIGSKSSIDIQQEFL